MTLPWIYILLTLSVLISKYDTLRIINYGSNDLTTENLFPEREASESCEGDESVSFNNLNILDVPTTAIKSRIIKNVNFGNNMLHSIPYELFGNVPSMECLNVARNKIPYMDVFNFGHDNLKTLIVDHQFDTYQFNTIITEFPYPKAHFPKLETLHANGINKFILDQFPKDIFPKLTTLFITKNEFKNIEKNFVSKLPPSLQHLHLERNDINDFNVYNVGQLQSLYLDENPLTSIYINSNNTLLQILSLRKCRLDSNILEYFMDFPLKYLEVLDLSENYLESIPNNLIDSASDLHTLLLNNNSIVDIPKIGQFNRLYRLSLAYNNINSVTNLISNSLRILNLQSNRINEIGISSFEHLPNLEELDLSKNGLNYLPPTWADNLRNLHRLILKFNMFANIADMSLTSLIDLRYLYCKGNEFHQIDEHDIQLIPDKCTTYVM